MIFDKFDVFNFDRPKDLFISLGFWGFGNGEVWTLPRSQISDSTRIITIGSTDNQYGQYGDTTFVVTISAIRGGGGANSPTKLFGPGDRHPDLDVEGARAEGPLAPLAHLSSLPVSSLS